MKAKTTGIRYEQGNYCLTQKHKAGERSHYKNGRYVNPTGFGWGTEYTPSRLIVGIIVNGHYNEVWVDRFFKDYWGKMTQGRVAAILKTLPAELSVEKNETIRGAIYYTVKEKSLMKWLEDAKKKC